MAIEKAKSNPQTIIVPALIQTPRTSTVPVTISIQGIRIAIALTTV
jgi:hypothetical protein